jgi:hypothetical protein
VRILYDFHIQTISEKMNAQILIKNNLCGKPQSFTYIYHKSADFINFNCFLAPFFFFLFDLMNSKVERYSFVTGSLCYVIYSY